MTRAARKIGCLLRGNPRVTAALGLLVLLEGGASVIDPQLPGWRGTDNETVILTGHATRLWGLSPGVRANLHTTATVGELSLRGAAPALPRPGGIERLMVVGDSTFFGFGIPDGETLLDVTAAALGEAGITTDTVNAAIPGYSTEQTLLLLDELGWSLEPTLLVVGSFWSDGAWEPFTDRELLRSQEAARYNPLVYSAVFRLLLGAIGGGEDDRVVTWTKSAGWPTDSVRRVPLAEYAANLDTLARAAAEREISMIFVTPPSALGLQDVEGFPWDPYLRAQATVARAHGLPRLDAARMFRELHVAMEADQDGLFLDEVHPTPDGHRRIGEAIAQTLISAGWPHTALVSAAEEPLDVTDISEWDDWLDRAEAPKMGSPLVNLFDVGGAGLQGLTAPAVDGKQWTASGRVQSDVLDGPITVLARSPAGKVVGRVQLSAPGRFALRISRQIPEVKLEISGPGGAAGATARVGGDLLDVTLAESEGAQPGGTSESGPY